MRDGLGISLALFVGLGLSGDMANGQPASSAPVLAAYHSSGAECQQPRRVIVHVAKPTVIYEDEDPCPEEKKPRKFGFLKRKHRQPPSAPPPMVGTILAPAPAFVPLAPGLPAPGAGCFNPPGGVGSRYGGVGTDELAIRAAQVAELAVRLDAARATLEAGMSAQQASVKRVGQALAPYVTPGAGKKPEQPPGAAPPETPDLSDVMKELERIRKAVEVLGARVEQHRKVLDLHHAADMKKFAPSADMK
jgi:hypothetical protein